MKPVLAAFAILSSGVQACGSPERCKSIPAGEAVRIAQEAKRSMLARSAQDYRENFTSDDASAVRVGSQTNGYAANVSFVGRNGATLIALIEDDCQVGWTEQ